jgi:hypothetical protein
MIEIVKPYDARGESIWVATVALCVLALWAAAVHGRLRGEDARVLESSQLDAFGELNAVEQGTFVDLRVAAEEIYQIYLDEEGAWPTLADVQAEGLPPFARDATWARRGRIEWDARIANSPTLDVALFLGRSGETDTSGSFLLEVHQHKQAEQDGTPYTIWYHPESPAWPLGAVQEFLVPAGWRQLVSYKGEDELRRLKGERR